MRALVDLLLPRRCPCGEAAGGASRAARPRPCVPPCRALLVGGVGAVGASLPAACGLADRALPRPDSDAGGVRRLPDRVQGATADVISHRCLALALVKALRELDSPPAPGGSVLLVPVPASRTALRTRGFRSRGPARAAGASPPAAEQLREHWELEPAASPYPPGGRPGGPSRTRLASATWPVPGAFGRPAGARLSTRRGWSSSTTS